MVYGYFLWWYGVGLGQTWELATAILSRIADFFSFNILVKTWVAPWKNDVLRAQNVSLGDQVKIWQQNLISRLVGFFIRTVMIVVCLLLIALTVLLLAVALVIWLALPILAILLPILGEARLFT